ncbi:putative disease resistance RPP13-like protein 3 [Salvia splendens]|uniref:putative disease resistance RPP13-like protein 3 n=1 Tax=Salvia splendens TaxID=180675 RepID=UPI001C27A2BB|nr:putative disease resistance RPP13-like protein 3 [Salvia splendens]
MAAYAALVSLAQTTTFDTNHAISDFSINAKENIRSIHEYVITLLTFLEDYPERTNRWEAKLRDIAHKIEDAIEQFMYYGGKETSSSFTFEKELKDVTLNLCLFAGDVMDERPSYSSLSSSSSSVAASRVPPTENGAAVGLDEDVMTIKDLLCGRPSSKLQVIPILGMGGIGKTTLARTVYDDPLITDYFDIRVWLTISQDYNARKVLLSLVDSIKMMDEHMPRLEMDDVSILMEKAYKKLKGWRYLVVMDDVWSTKVWDDVRNVFPDDANGSRIMITIRLEDLAVYPDSTCAPHKMRFMNGSQSWDLFKGKVFAYSNCPRELEDVRRKIARSCGGLPRS